MLGDMEDVKHELKLMIAGPDFLSKLAVVDAEKSWSSIVTPGPAMVLEQEQGGQLTGQGYPICEIIGTRTVYDSNDEQTKTRMHEVRIVWTHVGDNEATITSQLERLARATCDLLWPPDGPITLGRILSQPVEVLSEEYSGLFPANTPNTFVKGCEMVVRITTESL